MRPRCLFLILPLLLVFSCSSDREEAAPVVHLTEKQLMASLIPLPDSGSHAVTVQFRFPEILDSTPAPLADSLRDYVAGYIFASLDGEGEDTIGIEQMADELAADYRSLREDFPEYGIRWEVTRSGEVTYDSAGIVTLRLDEYTFRGGAHGLETSHLVSFDTESGSRLLLADLFHAGSEEGIGRLIEKEFRRGRGIGAEVSLSEAGFWVEEGKFPISEVWGVVRGGILFYYAPYEIGPYAVGPTEVMVPVERLRPFLEPNGAPGLR